MFCIDALKRILPVLSHDCRWEVATRREMWRGGQANVIACALLTTSSPVALTNSPGHRRAFNLSYCTRFSYIKFRRNSEIAQAYLFSINYDEAPTSQIVFRT